MLVKDVVVAVEMLYKKAQLLRIWYTHMEIILPTNLWVIEETIRFPMLYLLLSTITYEGFQILAYSNKLLRLASLN